MQRINKEKEVTRVNNDTVRTKIRVAIDTYYDIQKARIAMGNRLHAAFMEDVPDEEDSDEATAKLVNELIKEYRVVTALQDENNGMRVATIIKRHPDFKFITSVFYYKLVEAYVQLKETEKSISVAISKLVEEHPMYERYFAKVKGVGPIGAALCISYLDIHKAQYVSSFWSYVGVGLRWDEEKQEYVAMSRKSLTTVTYIDKDGNEATKKSLGYNSMLHTWLLGVLPTTVLMQGKGGVLHEAYMNAKNKYANRADLKDAPPMRIHRMAIRAMVKEFLRGLWLEWRSYEGYDITLPYEVQMLGYAPHKYNEYQVRKALNDNPEYAKDVKQ